MQAYNTHGENPLALVVDDDTMSRTLVREILEQAGFMVEESINGAKALEAIGNLNPDIIILDVMMPVLDGYSTCTEIRRLPAGNMVPVLMVTGLDDMESVQKAYDCGATDFISKPINFLIMRYRVLHILRANRTLQELKCSEARLAEAQRIAKMGSWEMNIATGEMIWSDEVYRIFGIDPVG
ncbi:MAG: response regulator, partial [Methanoregula sp.]|nr:response regulator [Methanoregula sp.]